MRLAEFKDAAEKNVQEALPAILGLARASGAAANKAAQTVKTAGKAAIQSVKPQGGSGPNATVGTQGGSANNNANTATSSAASSPNGIASAAADKATQQVSKKLVRPGGQIPLPNEKNQIQQYKVDKVQGDNVTLIDPKAKMKPGQPDKVVVSRKDIEPVIKGMVNKQNEA